MMDKQTLVLLLIITMVPSSDHTLKKGYFFMVEKDNDENLLTSTWSEARDDCRSLNGDLLTLDLVTESYLNEITADMNVVWMGLRRDEKNDSAWHWINTTIFASTTGDIAPTLSWFEENHSNHCALLNPDSTWSSKRCADASHGFFCSSHTKITYDSNEYTWQKAREKCKDNEGDLALKRGSEESIQNSDNSDNSGESENSHNAQSGWIGIYREGGDMWRTVGGQLVTDGAWGPGEPVTNDCGAYDAQRRMWQSYPCNALHNVACYEDNLQVVTEKKTWEEAMEHCRSLGTCANGTCENSLVTVESLSDNDYVRKRIYEATTDEVWTGLRFLGGRWFWMNGEPVNDEGMLPTCPSYGIHCGVVSKISDTPWLTADCSKKLNFICYKLES